MDPSKLERRVAPLKTDNNRDFYTDIGNIGTLKPETCL